MNPLPAKPVPNFYSIFTAHPPPGHPNGRKCTDDVQRSWDMPGATVVIVEDAATCATTLEMAFLAIPDIAVTVLPTAQAALHLLASGDCAGADGDRGM